MFHKPFKNLAGSTLILLALAARVPAAHAADSPPPAKTNNVRKVEFSDFKIVSDRNIFNSRRYARSSGVVERRETPRQVRIDTLTLVGTMSYEKGWFAFFDGSGRDFRKAVQPNEKVDVFTVSEITPGHVTLSWETNQVKLLVGMQMRREDGSAWHTNDTPEPLLAAYTSPTSSLPTVRPTQIDSQPQGGDQMPFPAFGGPDGPQIMIMPADGQMPVAMPMPMPAGAVIIQTNSAPADAGGGENDVLKRLMQRREQELNK